MALKARALYNFQSENKEEISIQENEELVIFSENSLDGHDSSYTAAPNPSISYQGSFEDDDDDDWDDWDDACTHPTAYSHHQHTGVEAFILGDVPLMSKIAEQTKFKGIKSYISYKLTPSNINSPATGRFEEDFIEKRKRRLILWMDHMTSHPVLSQYEGFQHFLCCRDEKQWKLGKRRAEKDEMVGASFLLTIQIPTEHQDLQDVEDRVDTFKAFSKKMEDSVLQLTNVASELVRKHVGGFRKEFQKLGNAFQAISHSFYMDPPYSSDALNNAISHTGKTYETVGEMFAEQPNNDLFLMLDTLSLYQGLLSNFPDIIHLQKGAFAKVKESQRMSDEGRMDQEEADGIRKRCRVVGFALQAEMNHFHERRVADFKRMMQSYLKQQIIFYQRVSQQLEKTLRMYDNL
ncbi:sorting nexin-33 [Patagioenas fasciata monilis]|uniref:Sorting nexin-33 n=1 Tax=Patagioenas fasciata monilis TaxID=372326 RepID=A0A1V4JEC3_PATFA|nr:sorting nexin-33 [Patagioenas fasciata monilis]